MKSHINISSNQVIQISTKIRNITTSFIHIIMYITQEIYLIYALSHHQTTSSMVPSLNGVTKKVY